MSRYRNLTASQEARRLARQQDYRREGRPMRHAAPPCPEAPPCALALTLALWRELDREHPGGLTMLEVARVAVERWGESIEFSIIWATGDLLESKLLRQVGVRIVLDRTQVANLPVFEPAGRWFE